MLTTSTVKTDGAVAPSARLSWPWMPTWLPTLIWQASTDSDPGDLVTYTVEVATNPQFSGFQSLAGLLDTQVTYIVEPNLWYYWRVKALDYVQAATYSSNSFSMFYFDPPGCCDNPGDVNHSGGSSPIDITDLVFLVDYFFFGGPEPPCPEEGNIDGSSDGEIDISDMVYLVDYMFLGGPEPAPCL